MNTYKVSVEANAIRTITVRARDGSEALDIAQERIGRRAGPWLIEFPGDAGEHFTVHRQPDGTWVGPDGAGNMLDAPEEYEGGT